MRVLELSNSEGAAAYAGKLFQRWGAEVIKIERPGRAEPRRHEDLYLNGGKRRVRLNVGDERERSAIERLAAEADVLLSDYPVADLDALGVLSLGGEPGPMVRVSITPFGLSGPYREFEATSSTLLALGGYTWLMGDPGRAPLTMPGNYVLYQAGTYAYLTALAELLAGRRQPVSIEVSMLECLASLHQFTDTMWQFGEVVRSRHGNRWENLCPTTLLPSADGWYGINILLDFWFPFAQMIGRGDLAAEGPLANNAGRMEQQDLVESIITKALWDVPKKQLFREGQEAWRVPIGYAASLQELLDDPHLGARSFWRGVEAGPQVVVPGSPFRVEGEDMPAELALLEAEAGPREAAWRSMQAAMSGSAAPAHRPLEGVRVLDLTRIWSGPVATRILGDLGAEVIKIEAHEGRGPRTPDGGEHWNRQGLFNKLNRNKKSIAINLKVPEGRQIFLELVAQSDVVIENFSARAMPSLGLGYEELRRVNEQIIYLAMPAFGMSGPYRDYVGLGPSIEPLSGLTAIMGYSDDEPRVTAAALTDPIAGTTAASAVVTALWRRSETGKGALIDLSQHEAGVAFLGEYFVERQLTGEEPKRIGNRHRTFAPHGVYRCLGTDDWIAIAARDAREWAALCDVLGIADVAGDPRFSSLESRRANADALDEMIERATVAREKRELEAALQAKGVPAGAVLSAPEYLADPHLSERRYFAELDHPEAGRSTWDGSPMRFDGERGYADWDAAPCLGGDNRAILGALLGMSDERLGELYASGVLAEMPPG
jgi:crotonobetainyl-CoA:carnitine CoA-transferase CaiB-like acyl-CoA transferase